MFGYVCKQSCELLAGDLTSQEESREGGGPSFSPNNEPPAWVHSFIRSFIKHTQSLGQVLSTKPRGTRSLPRAQECETVTWASSGPLHVFKGKERISYVSRVVKEKKKNREDYPQRPSGPQSLDYLLSDRL